MISPLKCLQRWPKLTVLACSLFVLGLGLMRYHRSHYPYGLRHCCIVQMSSALRMYAEDFKGRYPAGQATPEASLTLLYRQQLADAWLLSGKTVPVEKTKAALVAGQMLGPDTCGWHYVEGLTADGDPRLALLWCKVALGHNGEVMDNGGREVCLLDGSCPVVTAKEWPAFLAAQKELLAKHNPEGSP